MSKRITFIDLFAGAGGLSLGLTWAGAEPVFAVEQDKWAAETYAANHPGVPIAQRDVRDFTDEEIAHLRTHDADLLVGGPPCQGFSHSNVANRDPKDPRNSLFQEFIRFAKVLRPAACLIENVPGLLKTKLHEGDSVISVIVECFREIGYTAEHRILEASQYGVPQKRERLFIIAVRDDLARITKLDWPSPTHGMAGTSAQTSLFDSHPVAFPTVTLWDAISDLPQIVWEDAGENQSYRFPPKNDFQRLMRANAPQMVRNHEPMKHTARVVERFRSISYGQSEADVPANLRPRRRGKPDEMSGKTYAQNSRRQRPDEPCNTMVASSHTNYIHPMLDRNFTVREMMRIQSFPDHFVLCGKRAVLSKKLSEKKGLTDDLFLDQRAQVGNAVPPLLAEQIGTALLQMFDNERMNEAA